MRKLLYILPISIILLGLAALIVFKITGGQMLDQRSAQQDKSIEQFFEEARREAKPSLSQIEPRTVTFLAVGDISLSRGIALTVQKNNDPLTPFKGMDALLKSTDFNFGNLESPFSKSDSFTAKETLVFNAPKPNVAGLKAYNFQVLNLANNHAYDQGFEGIATTGQVLNENGLLHMGTGKTLEEAWAPAIIERNGITVGFIGASYSSVNDGGKALNNYVARIEDTKRLQDTIARLKSSAQGGPALGGQVSPPVDFIVVTMHAGTEYVRKPNQSQIDFAHAAVNAGADMVIGHHAHWVQEKEIYCPNTLSTKQDVSSGSSPSDASIGAPINSIGVREAKRSIISFDDTLSAADITGNCKPIYYGLGNFIFDQYWSEETKKGLVLKITLTKPAIPSLKPVIGGAETASGTDLQPAGQKPLTTIEKIEEIPTYIKNNCCPTVQPTQ